MPRGIGPLSSSGGGVNRLSHSSARLATVRSVCSSAMAQLASGNVDRALLLAEGALADVADAGVRFGPDELAVDAIVAVLAVASEIAQEPRHAAAAGSARVLVRRALKLRIAALRGESVE